MFTLQIQLDDSIYLNDIGALSEFLITNDVRFPPQLRDAIGIVVEKLDGYLDDDENRCDILSWRNVPQNLRRLADVIDQRIAERKAMIQMARDESE